MFRESTLMAVAAIVSLLLQVISFFTTLNGAKAYFEAAFALTPLFFALAVQSVVYFLENGIRRKPSLGKTTALTLAILCSSYFSFVGIYSAVNPPERYLEDTYNSYSKQLSSEYERLLSQENSTAQSAVNKAVNGIIREYSAASAELTTLELLAEEIAQVGTEDSHGLTAPRRWDYYTYEDYAAAYSEYIASLSENSNTEQQAKTQALLAKQGLSDAAQLNERIGTLKAKLSLTEGIVGASGSGFYTKAEELRARISAGDEALAQRIFSLYADMSGEEVDVPKSLSDDYAQLELPAYTEIAGAASAAEIRESLVRVISAACDVINSVGGAAKQSEYTFESVYTLPVRAVMNGMSIDAAVSLILAVLVDLLSLMFAMIFVREKSVLSAADTKSAVGMSDDLFEKNLVTALQLSVCGGEEGFSGRWDSGIIAEKLAGFVSQFRAADGAVQRGFSLIAEGEALRGYAALVAFLCQFSLAKTLSGEEAALLTNGEQTAPCVLLKTKFLLWVSERFCTKERLCEQAEEETA